MRRCSITSVFVCVSGKTREITGGAHEKHSCVLLREIECKIQATSIQVQFNIDSRCCMLQSSVEGFISTEGSENVNDLETWRKSEKRKRL